MNPHPATPWTSPPDQAGRRSSLDPPFPELPAGLEAVWEELLRRERQAAETERHFAALMELAPVGIFLTDAEGRCRFVNPHWCHLSGRAAESALGYGWADALEPDDQVRVQQEWEASVRDGGEFHTEHRFRRPDGTVRWVVAQAVALSEEGRVTGFLGTVTDITGRKNAELELLAHEGRYRLLAEHSTDMICSCDPDGTMRYVSPASRAVLGFAPEELSGRSPYEFFHPDDSERLARNHALLLADPAPRAIQYRARHNAGHYVWVETTTRHLPGPDGKPESIITLTRDITRRKQAEEDLRHAKEAAEAASRAKSAFLATMSHELRNPMNAVVGMADLILHDELSPRQRERARVVHDSAQALLAILNDLLDLAKIEAGKLDLARNPFDPRRLCETSLGALAAAAGEKGLSLTWVVEPDVPALVLGDADRLRQILVNLAGNAVKFTERGGVTVTLSVERENRQEEGAPRSPLPALRFEVSDTGIGIPAERLDAIFRPFEQADATTTRRHGGTGLGLSISRSLVERMGGRIEVRSEVGRGSVFAVTLPLEAAPVTPTVPPTAAAVRPLRILVAEDNPINQRVAVQLLQRIGHSVQAVGNGREALATLARESFDVLLMDIQMPEMDGLDAARHIRAAESRAGAAARRLPIVAMTANALREDREACRDAGMDAFLAKPVRPDDLYRTVAEAAAVR